MTNFPISRFQRVPAQEQNSYRNEHPVIYDSHSRIIRTDDVVVAVPVESVPQVRTTGKKANVAEIMEITGYGFFFLLVGLVFINYILLMTGKAPYL